MVLIKSIHAHHERGVQPVDEKQFSPRVRSRLRTPGERPRPVFAETPPLEAKRMLFSRASTRDKLGRFRKLMFIDAKKAHLNPICDGDVYLELPGECKCPEGMCAKLNYWM